MHMIIIPTDLLEKPEVATALRDDRRLGEQCFIRTILKIARAVNFGQYFREGKFESNYKFQKSMDKEDWWIELKLHKSETEQLLWLGMLKKLEENSVFILTETEYALTIEYPEMMSMIAPSEQRDLQRKFGTKNINDLSEDEKFQAYESRMRAADNDMSRHSREQNKQDKNKLDKNKQDIKQLEKSNIHTPSQSPRLSEGVSNDEEKDIYTMNIKGKEINVLDFIAQNKEQQTDDK